jgi:hypothetical protein
MVAIKSLENMFSMNVVQVFFTAASMNRKKRGEKIVFG